MEEIIKQLGADPEDLYFWALHQGGELDLLWKKGTTKTGYEFKYADSPKPTSSMKKAVELLGLDELHVVYPGKKRVKIDEKITLMPLG